MDVIDWGYQEKNLDLKKRSFIDPNNQMFFNQKIDETENHQVEHIFSPGRFSDLIAEVQGFTKGPKSILPAPHLQLKRLHHGSDMWQREA